MKSSMLVSIASPPMIRAYLISLSSRDAETILEALGRARGTIPGEAAQIVSAAFANLQDLEVVAEQPMPTGDPGPYVPQPVDGQGEIFQDPPPPPDSDGGQVGAGTSNAGAGAGDQTAGAGPTDPPPPPENTSSSGDPAPEVMTTSGAQIPPFQDPAKPADAQG